ncbi:hypothetical protein HD806DRAFT_526950 [Xylariaceae sp. AK1471]|nr:hypothetical protein HD806DRAFT_526950 [Xylariaceae sp. AK1471]
MATIYAGAFITISGTGCTDNDEGFFKNSPIVANTKMITNTSLAGLWKETIANDLLWWCLLKDLGPRPQPIVTPTWPWASSRPLWGAGNWSLSQVPTYIEFEKYVFKPMNGGDKYSQPFSARLYVEGLAIFGTITGIWSAWEREIRMEFEYQTIQIRPDYDISAPSEDYIRFSTSLLFLLLLNHKVITFGIMLTCKALNVHGYYSGRKK